MKHLTKIIFCISVFSIIYILTVCIKSNHHIVNNNIENMTATITNEIIPYETVYTYNASKPTTAEPVVIEEGTNGLSLTYDGLNYKVLNEKKDEVIELGSGPSGEYTGRLTGYGADCPGCSAVGNVSCLTKEGKKHSLTYDGMYYNDYMYGEVRIIAAETKAFPCGTIINIENSNVGRLTAIVLDTGYSMRNAWANGKMWIDLAFVTQEDARKGMATNDNTSFSVQRWGW